MDALLNIEMLSKILLAAVILGVLSALAYMAHVDFKDTDAFIKELELQRKLKENKQSC